MSFTLTLHQRDFCFFFKTLYLPVFKRIHTNQIFNLLFKYLFKIKKVLSLDHTRPMVSLSVIGITRLVIELIPYQSICKSRYRLFCWPYLLIRTGRKKVKKACRITKWIPIIWMLKFRVTYFWLFYILGLKYFFFSHKSVQDVCLIIVCYKNGSYHSTRIMESCFTIFANAYNMFHDLIIKFWWWTRKSSSSACRPMTI